MFDGLESIWGAVWSPDGQHIAFTSSESGRRDLRNSLRWQRASTANLRGRRAPSWQ
ncbi:MAG: PD40 domain-containing protein [Anaerolineae bacterium]|nr:MAG: PD40 domain-containing protein [Anaerolineae bacterium]